MDISIRPLAASDIGKATEIFRTAFGTFIKLPEPSQFMGDADMIGPRADAPHCGAWGAYLDGALVASALATRWGRFGFFGPLTVRPDLWDQRVGQELMAAAMADLKERGVRRVGLFTFPDSPKHLVLYRKFGFWPQHLTTVMVKGPEDRGRLDATWTYSDGTPEARERFLAQADDLCDTLSPGLSLADEIRELAKRRLGDTIALLRDGELESFAVCHIGKGSEAGSGAAYIKFAVARGGPGAGDRFVRLLDTGEAFAAASGAKQVMAGVNTARADAYDAMLARGWRIAIVGVSMQNPNEAGFCRPDCYVIDDWR